MLHIVISVQLGFIWRLKDFSLDFFPVDALEPRMALNFFSIGFAASKSLGGVFFQQAGAQIPGFWHQEIVIHFWFSVLNVLVELIPVFTVKGRQTNKHLVDDGAKGPPICCFAMSLTLQYFGTQVFCSAAKTFGVFLSRNVFLRQSKVSQLDIAITADKHVLGLKISIKDVFAMEVF